MSSGEIERLFVDFTLAEFADAAPTAAVTGRMKKATTRRWDKNGMHHVTAAERVRWMLNFNDQI